MPETEQAQRGARSGEGPSPGREGGMEPQGFGSNPRLVYLANLVMVGGKLVPAPWMTFRPELDPDL
jgi:hypothetical protein